MVPSSSTHQWSAGLASSEQHLAGMEIHHLAGREQFGQC